MKNALLILIAILSVMYVQAQTITSVNVNEFEKKLTNAKEKTILDVRTSGEFSEGHLANAVNIDFYKSDFKQSVSKLDKNKPVFVYCLGGGRSSSAADILKDLGFKQVVNMEGGMKAWSGAKKPVVK